MNCGGTGEEGGESCFPRGTKVRTAAGEKPIESIAVGDAVLAATESGELVSRRVVRKFAGRASGVLTLDLGGGQSIRVTPSHTLLTDRGWKQVRSLRVGDRIRISTERMTSARIHGAQGSANSEDVFNLVVEGESTFLADGVVANSFTVGRYVRMRVNAMCFALRDGRGFGWRSVSL